MRIQHWWSHMHTLQCNASTLHGVLRAPHGDGKEAILLATPVSGVYLACYLMCLLQQTHYSSWLRFTQGSQPPCVQILLFDLSIFYTAGNLAADYTAIQVAAAVLQYLQHVPWLAKDIVWIIPDVSCGALQMTRVRNAVQDHSACKLLICFFLAWRCNMHACLSGMTALTT